MPEQLVEKYRPKTLAEFAGVDRPRAILEHFAARPYSSAWLLLGPSGLGKTTMALAIADKIGGQIHHIPARKCDLAMVNDVSQRCHYRPLIGDFNIVIADEADKMSNAARDAFLSVLDTTGMPPDTIFFFTANADRTLREEGQTGKGRFLSRVRTVEFSTDGILEPVAALLARIWKVEAPRKTPPDFRAIVRDAGFNVRSAIMALEIELIVADVPTARRPIEPPEPMREVASVSGGILTAREYATALGINVATLYKRMQDGKLPKPASKKPLTWRKEVLAA